VPAARLWKPRVLLPHYWPKATLQEKGIKLKVARQEKAIKLLRAAHQKKVPAKLPAAKALPPNLPRTARETAAAAVMTSGSSPTI
jgi:hypothetical protein